MKNLVAALTLRFVDRLSQPARSAASRIGTVERAQRMADKASKQWSQGLAQLDDRLGRLASASLVTDGLTRAGESLMRPLRRGVVEAAEFNRGMTGIGITAQMTDRQLAPMRKSIMQTAADIGALPSVVQGAFASVLAEGVYKTESELTAAGRSVARFQKLAAVMRDPISGDEAGGLSAGLATSFNVSADRLDRANAMLNRSAQQGGVGIGVLARYIPEQAAAMKGLGGNNERGLADLLAANQVSKIAAGSSDSGANNITNLLSTVTSPETIRNFAKIGINLEAEIKKGIQNGISPLETVADLTKRVTGGDQFAIGRLFGDRQARSGMMALVQNLDRFKADAAELRGAGVLEAYYADLARATEGTAASFERYTSATARAGIATGTILSPAVSLAADLLGGIAGWMSEASESGSILAKAATWVVAGFAGIAVGAGAVGNAVVGILGPIYILRTIFGSLGGAGLKMVAAGLLRFVGVIVGPVMGAIRILSIGLLTTPVGWIILGITAVATAAYLIVRNWSTVKRWWSAFWGWAGRAAGQAWQAIKLAFAVSPLGTFVRSFVTVYGFFSRLQARFQGFGRAIMQGLVSGIRSMLGSVRDAVMNTASSAVDWFKNRLGIRSPSRIFAGLGADTMAGLTLGLDRGGRAAVASVAAVGGAMIGAMPATAAAGYGASAAGVGGVRIERVEIHVTVQGVAGNASATGRAAGSAAADAFRARLFDGA